MRIPGLGIALCCSIIVQIAHAESPPTKRDWQPAKLAEAIPATAYHLFQWPDAEAFREVKQLKPDSRAFTSAKMSSLGWIKLVLDPSWCPPNDFEPICLREEFDGRDTVRMHWGHDGYRIEASQTNSVVAFKFTPLDGRGTGEGLEDRTAYVKKLCQKIFTDQAAMEAISDQCGPTIAVDKLKQRIADFSFVPAQIQELPADKVVVGFEKSMRDKDIQLSFDYVEDKQSADPVTGSWQAGRYWFRNIRWWNDGMSVGFYLLKTNGPGSWLPCYGLQGSGKWFQATNADEEKP